MKGKHWVAWDDLCYPHKEGGVGFRSLRDVAKALFVNLWWNLRVATNSLWGNFMWNKFCKKDHPEMAKGSGASHIWKKLIQIREEMEHEIWWKIKEGKCSFWYDKWTNKELYTLLRMEE